MIVRTAAVVSEPVGLVQNDDGVEVKLNKLACFHRKDGFCIEIFSFQRGMCAIFTLGELTARQ